jgi:hypothetical protein
MPQEPVRVLLYRRLTNLLLNRRLTNLAVKPFLSEGPMFAAPRAVGERPVQLFARGRRPAAALGIWTARKPVSLSSGPVVSVPTARAPTTLADQPRQQRPVAPNPEAGGAEARSGAGGAVAGTDVLYVLMPSGSGAGCTVATVEGAAAASGGAEGWMLLALRGQRQQWSMSLVGRGVDWPNDLARRLVSIPAVLSDGDVRTLYELARQSTTWTRELGGGADRIRLGPPSLGP